MAKRQKKEKRRTGTDKTVRALANFSQIGFTIAASILVGVFLGKFFDRLLNTTPWMLLVFSLLGVASAIWTLFKWPTENK